MNHRPTPVTPTNTRRHHRYELDTPLIARVVGASQTGITRGRSLDISIAGIAGLFPLGWDVGTTVSLEFSVPLTSSPMRVVAVIRYRKQYRYGFEFVELSAGQRELIDRTCHTLALLQTGTAADRA